VFLPVAKKRETITPKSAHSLSIEKCKSSKVNYGCCLKLNQILIMIYFQKIKYRSKRLPHKTSILHRPMVESTGVITSSKYDEGSYIEVKNSNEGF
jgi:hypothetical protein